MTWHIGGSSRVLDPARLEVASCAAPTMALAHVHTARRLHFAASSDGLLIWLSEECWCRGLIRFAGLLVGAAFSEGVELLTERQAEQPEPHLDPDLEALLPF